LHSYFLKGILLKVSKIISHALSKPPALGYLKCFESETIYNEKYTALCFGIV
jgi:hypothetical protein